MSFKLKHMIFGKIAIILIFCLLVTNVYGFNNSIIVSYADDAITASNPLLMPLSGWLTAVAIGTGIIGKNASDSANQLIANVANNLKEKEIQKSLEDESYDSPFRVISGGSDKTPQKPNNENKNGKWFALGTATAGASAMLFEKGALETAMETFNDLQAYQQIISELGIKDAETVISSSSASNVALQLAKISNLAVTQFDGFLHSDFFTNNSLDVDNCLFNVNVGYSDLNSASPKLPFLWINVMEKSPEFKKLRVDNNPFGYRTVSSDYFNYSGYFVNYSNINGAMLNDDNIAVNTKYYKVKVFKRTEEENLTYSVDKDNNSNSNYIVYGGSAYSYFYAGYVWAYENPWGLTNNVYNVNQTFDVNFPDWQQGIMEILGQQLQGVQIGGITSPNVTWEPTQEQIQSGTTPASVIYQYINNYQNPENIPDEEEGPDTPVVVPPAIEEPQPTNDYLGNFLLPESITTKFPFCIPFDIARALRLFSVSQREAPKWECDLNYGSSSYHVIIDLAMFNDVASFIRPLEFILFLVGLALGTRSLIRG